MARFRGSDPGKRTPAPGKTGRGDKKSGAFSQQPALERSFSANTVFCSGEMTRQGAFAHGPAEGRETSASPDISWPCPQQWGWGFGRQEWAHLATTMGSHAQNFFRLFDFDPYSSVAYRGK